MRTLVKSIFLTLVVFITTGLMAVDLYAKSAPKNQYGKPASLPLPSSLPLINYERKLYKWILKRKYTKLGWAYDKGVRDTGPFLDGVYYGTHPAVRIFYSPEVMEWLLNGRPEDTPIPDGAVIVKEMYTPPAAIYQQFAQDPKYQNAEDYEKLLASLVNNWTVMIKDSSASSDGWFWGSVGLPKEGQSIKEAINEQVDTLKNRGNSQLRWSGFAMPCIRCHASAKAESTFSDLNNIKGQPGQPLIFKSDDSWRNRDYFTSTKNYPLTNFKDDEYVKRFMQWGKGKQSTTDIKETSIATADFSDHKITNNFSAHVPSKPNKQASSLFLSTFPEIPELPGTEIKRFPPEWLDHVVMPADHPTEFVTSDNCVGCHGGLSGGINRNVMFVPKKGHKAKDGYNLSEYGEWRWSPMGLAGRDPIFHSQLESEMELLKGDAKYDKENPDKPKLLKGTLPDTQHAVTNTCLSCHGAMGQRQLFSDAQKNSNLDPNFKVDYFYHHEALNKKELKRQKKQHYAEYTKYGALAREGISCMICHHMDAPDAEAVKTWSPESGWITSEADKTLAFNLFYHSTGRYNPGAADEVFGPFKDVSILPMQNALNVTPIKNDYISDSQMCGNCHTINLPNIGAPVPAEPSVLDAAAAETPFADYSHSIEQATFLEWQNSAFAAVDENGNATDSFQSCQQCHMPSGFESIDGKIKIDPLVTQIASIQDSSYSESGHTISNKDLDIPLRDNYKRHTHVGLNVFLLSMVDQFSELLGVQKTDYMTGSENGAQLAIDSMIQQAQQETVGVDISEAVASKVHEDGQLKGVSLKAKVTVTNKTGHRFPSGVAFRRAFIEFTVKNKEGKIVWQSGGTNGVGVIVKGHDSQEPLITEFLPNKNEYQTHYTTITSENQVQIYEELNLNAHDEFTTSFVHRVTDVKDNRLLPRGWKESQFFKDQGKVMLEYMEATDPHGLATNDPDYQSGNNLDFAGQDSLYYKISLPNDEDLSLPLSVTATLYNQSIPPYWLKHRFTEAPNGVATKRLHHISSHLDLTGTEMENWKLKLVSDSKTAKTKAQ